MATDQYIWTKNANMRYKNLSQDQIDQFWNDIEDINDYPEKDLISWSAFFYFDYQPDVGCQPEPIDMDELVIISKKIVSHYHQYCDIGDNVFEYPSYIIYKNHKITTKYDLDVIGFLQRYMKKCCLNSTLYRLFCRALDRACDKAQNEIRLLISEANLRSYH